MRSETDPAPSQSQGKKQGKVKKRKDKQSYQKVRQWRERAFSWDSWKDGQIWREALELNRGPDSLLDTSQILDQIELTVRWRAAWHVWGRSSTFGANTQGWLQESPHTVTDTTSLWEAAEMTCKLHWWRASDDTFQGFALFQRASWSPAQCCYNGNVVLKKHFCSICFGPTFT